MSTRTNILSTLLATTAAFAVMLPATASANPCQSTWTKFKNFFDQNGAKLAHGICFLANKQDPAAAKKCTDTFDQAKQKIDAKLAEYNAKADDGQWKIGPRGLGEAQWATGTLLAERTFAGAPILSDSYTLELQRTGGKANNDLKATVCFLDGNGQMKLPAATFTINSSRPNFSNTYQNVAGLTPVILLQKPAGVNGHQYQIRGTRGSEPQVVREARVVVNPNTNNKAAKMGKGG